MIKTLANVNSTVPAVVPYSPAHCPSSLNHASATGTMIAAGSKRLTKNPPVSPLPNDGIMTLPVT
jgi:hypothetical protein